MKKIVLMIVLAACAAMAGCSKEGKGPDMEAKVGASAPEFTLKDLSGKDVSLASLRGKVVMLNFWATWCPPCKEEIPSMMRLNQAMSGKPFQMLAVSIDDGGKPAVEAFFKQSGFSLPALNDPGQSIGKLYGVTGVPETFVIDKKGVILKKFIGGLDWSAPEVIKYFNELTAQ